MNDLFDDPGDLGFFDKEDELPNTDELMEESDFYEPFPGEDVE